jgi:outer membrane lipopolysaccharide assembly protein LptE/RlpB
MFKRINMKKLAMIAAVFLLAGCGNSAKEMAVQVLPEGLKDCKFYELVIDGSRIKVVRCPNSTTTTNWKEQVGKVSHLRTASVVS